MIRRLPVLLLAVLSLAAAAGTAQAHVIVHPNVLPGERLNSILVRVLNERTNADTIKLDVKFPDGFISVYYQSIPGWKTAVFTRKLQAPITINGKTLTQQVDRLVWTNTDPARAIKPFQLQEFPLAVAVPGRPTGTVILFKALQYYSNGEIVRWIGGPDAEFPAAQVVVVDPNAQQTEFPAGPAAATRSTSSSKPALGLVLGVPLLGLGGFLAIRRRQR